jgi:hypothetical protein
MRVLAVDWSGARQESGRHTWLAEAVEPGRLAQLTPIRRQDLLAQLPHDTSECVIGLDFAFAFPAWFMRELGCETAHALWRMAAECGEAWLHNCESPFWGRPGRPRPSTTGPHFRRSEVSVPARPKSAFQIGGAGSVGTGSIRGMPLLLQLHEAGASIWPFDPPAWPRVVEIYPRLLTGPVVKSDALAREALLRLRCPNLGPEHMNLAIASEDAFDAAISALVMLEHWPDFLKLTEESDVELRLEGRIWHPQWRAEVRLGVGQGQA